MKLFLSFTTCVVFLFLITTGVVYANYANKPEVDNCLAKSLNKLIVPSDAAMTVQKSCSPEMVCVEIPPNFSCIYFGFVDKSNVIPCTEIQPEPPNSSPSEPLPPPLPLCESVQCPVGQTRVAAPDSITCTYKVLELNPALKATYDTQKASAEATATVYQESQLYNNIQDYCFYTTGLACPAMPPATFNATASSLSGITGKTVEEVKKLMKKKVKK